MSNTRNPPTDERNHCALYVELIHELRATEQGMRDAFDRLNRIKQRIKMFRYANKIHNKPWPWLGSWHFNAKAKIRAVAAAAALLCLTCLTAMAQPNVKALAKPRAAVTTTNAPRTSVAIGWEPSASPGVAFQYLIYSTNADMSFPMSGGKFAPAITNATVTNLLVDVPYYLELRASDGFADSSPAKLTWYQQIIETAWPQRTPDLLRQPFETVGNPVFSITNKASEPIGHYRLVITRTKR